MRVKLVLSNILSDFPSNFGLIDFSFFLSIFDPSFVANITWKFSLYLAGQFPNSHFKLYFLKEHLGSKFSISKFFGKLSWNETSLISWINELFLNLYNIFILVGSSEIDFTIFFALGSGIRISFSSTYLKLIQIFAKIGNKIIEKTKRTAGSVSIYAVFFSVFAKVSFIKKADNLYYPLF